MVDQLMAVPRRWGFGHLPSQRIPTVPADRGQRGLGIPGLRLGPGSCHAHSGWSCPISIPLHVDPISTLPLVLGCHKESDGWEQETAQTELRSSPGRCTPGVSAEAGAAVSCCSASLFSKSFIKIAGTNAALRRPLQPLQAAYGAEGKVSVTILHARNKPGAQTPPLTAGAQNWEQKGGVQDRAPPGGCLPTAKASYLAPLPSSP